MCPLRAGIREGEVMALGYYTVLHGCVNKRRYTSLAKAKRSVHALGQHHAYRCPVCHGWHISSGKMVMHERRVAAPRERVTLEEGE